MRTWELPVPLDDQSPEPLFLQIARAMSDDIRRGRLRPGAPLPGSRVLAESLQVHRNTVLAAYAELASQGWIITHQARGTFVTDALPDIAPRRFSREPSRQQVPMAPGFDVPALPPNRGPLEFPSGALVLASGIPDLRLAPVEEIARAHRRALRLGGKRLLGYADAAGEPSLRRAMAAMVSSLRGVAATADHVLITRGSQMALDLCARLLVRPGDRVAVEAMGYAPAWAALRAAGATLVPIPVDDEGIDVAALADAQQAGPLRAIYVTPHHQYPTTVVMSAARRLALLELARRERVPILEDDYDHEFHYEGRPVLPLASADTAGVVVYIGTLSKILAPGLRLGFVVAPRVVIERLAVLRTHVDRQGDQAMEAAVAELIDDGTLQRHVRRMRRVYQERRDVLCAALDRDLGDRVAFERPRGGLALWVRTRLDVERWAARAMEEGTGIYPARQFAFDGRSRNAVRLGYAMLNERELREAVRRLVRALP